VVEAATFAGRQVGPVRNKTVTLAGRLVALWREHREQRLAASTWNARRTWVRLERTPPLNGREGN